MDHPERPRNLSGKQIGMWYKNQSQKKKKTPKQPAIKFGPNITLPSEFVMKLRYILRKNENINLQNLKIESDFEKYFNETLNTSFEEFLQKQHLHCLTATSSENTCDNPTTSQSQLQNGEEKYKPYFDKFIPLKLPVFDHKYEILNEIEKNRFVLISGDTGCGKTTQIPQFILDNYNEKGFRNNYNKKYANIICTQPRRISAITVAERVAMERNESLGNSVGYLIRLEKNLPYSKKGTILYCTNGILLRQIETDPLLANVTHIIIDEIHERNIESDLLIGLLKIIVKYNKNLKIILMSATFGIDHFSKHFDNCSIVRINGTLFPIEVNYLEDILEEIKFFDFQKPLNKFLPKHLRNRKSNKAETLRIEEFEDFMIPYVRSIENSYSRRVIDTILNPNIEIINLDLIKALIISIANYKPSGAILVFLPGYDKISKLYELMLNTQGYRDNRYAIYNLHSMMPTVNQKEVFERPPYGVRKIILATNIAETSITIDDVVYVINSGRVKVKDYDIDRNYQTLLEEWVALSHSKQRQGRAGRCQPGICYNLYTRAREYTFNDYPIPEIQRIRLEPVILQLKMLRIHNVLRFFNTLISCPNERTLENGVEQLKRINALNENETITPLGLHLARLPLDPQIGKMLLISAIFKCIDPITSIAATLSFKDPFHMVIGKEKQIQQIKQNFSNSSNSDHIMFANVLNDYEYAKKNNFERNYCYENFLASSTLYQLSNMKKQLYDNLLSAGFIESSTTNYSNKNSNNYHLLRSVIAAGLYPNVAYIKSNRQKKNRVATVTKIITPEDGKRVDLHPASINFGASSFESNYLVYFNKQKTTNVFLYDTTMIYPISFIIFGDQFETGYCENNDDDDYNNDNKYYVSIAKKLYFRTNESTLNLIVELRNRFEMFLRKIALNPNEFTSNFCSDESLIEALILLLSYKDEETY